MSTRFLSFPHEWDPQNVYFHSYSRSFQDEIQINSNINVIDYPYNTDDAEQDSPSTLFDIASINTRIINSVNINHYDSIDSSDRKISSVKKINLTETK